MYVPAGTPPTQSVPMPVIPQQPDVILRQEMAVAPGKHKIVPYFDFLSLSAFLHTYCVSPWMHRQKRCQQSDANFFLSHHR